MIDTLLNCDHEFFQFLLEYQTTVDHSEEGPSSLHFNNPTEGLSTRWDVVYKTLLRDWRKHFWELFANMLEPKPRSRKRKKNMNNIHQKIESYCSENFGYLNSSLLEEVTFYLKCLVQHRMAIFKSNETVSNRNLEDDREYASRAKKLHGILYKFSLEKWEQFFENPALSLIFKEYMKTYPLRLENNLTLRKQEDVYYNALKLILLKINKSYQHNYS